MTPTATVETTDLPDADLTDLAPAPAVEEGVLEDLLVEEVSIDGMCGVY